MVFKQDWHIPTLRLAFGLAMTVVLITTACDPAKRVVVGGTNRPAKPAPGKTEPMDTLRWTQQTNKPVIKNDPNSGGDRPVSGSTYHIGFLLPFLTNQATGVTVPEKSRLGLQFYAGAKIALEEVSAAENINLVVDVWDTQSTDADFQTLLNTNTRLQKPAVFIGPVRSTHVEIFSEWAKSRRKIVVSPESPNLGLTSRNPDFIQLNPSLKAHCEAITRYVRKLNRPEAITLVCREKEADRLPYFQQMNSSLGGGAFAELVVPDAAQNFDKIDLKKYLKQGRTNVFILPSWSSQDFIMAFLRKLKEIKGTHRIEVYGMPQWRSFESIDPEYLVGLGVHISAGAWINYQDPHVKDFQQKFYEATGTIPDEDAFNGYDVTRFVAGMLVKYGLSFPEKLEKANVNGLHGPYAFGKVFLEGLDAAQSKPDYWENKQVFILKFTNAGYQPAN